MYDAEGYSVVEAIVVLVLTDAVIAQVAREYIRERLVEVGDGEQ